MPKGKPGSRGVCSIEGCDRVTAARGWCGLHWRRWKKHGDPMGDVPPMNQRQGSACSVNGCDKPPLARGWCGMHYSRWQVHGDPRADIPSYRGSVEHRFWMRVKKTETCWLWTGSTVSDGYGYLITDDGSIRVHRLAYEMLCEPIPQGMQIDHICGIRACVNPKHLRIATSKQNAENVTVVRSDNACGVRGVYQRPSGKWVACVTHHGVRHYLGQFGTIGEAEAAAISKRNELFTHNEKDRRSA